MRKILAIGGAVIKTARRNLLNALKNDKVEMLIHNGGSLFHDLQITSDKNLVGHSYLLDDLIHSFDCNKEASKLVWNFLENYEAPDGSITKFCIHHQIPVLMFTAPYCDFWFLQHPDNHWKIYQDFAEKSFNILRERFEKENFHYVCMGSLVIHPEVFIKVIALTNPKKFIADAVDFQEAYRPRTRVAKFGSFYMTTHDAYLDALIAGKV